MLNEVRSHKHGGEQQFSSRLLKKATESVCTEIKPILQGKKSGGGGGEAPEINNRVKQKVHDL